MKHKNIWEFIAKHLAGESTEHEKESISAWQHESDQNRKVLNLIGRIRINLLHSEDVSDTKKRVLHKLNQRLLTESQPPKRIKMLPVVWAFAASVAFLAMVGLFYQQQKISDKASDFIVYNNPIGGKASLKLPDGSEVWLNAGTQLVYPSHFSGNSREVFLTGEAWFKVSKDKKHPFIVKTGTLAVTVLGTTFNLKAYYNEEKVEATLLTGAVSVSVPDNPQAEPVMLAPDQRVVYKKSDRTFMLESTDPLIYTSWKEGIINCRSQRFEELAHILERKFDVTVVFLNEDLKNEVYTGKFENNESLEDILEIIQISTKMNFYIKGKVIEIG